MLRFEVTNESGRDFTWNTEPVALGVVLAPGDSLVVSVDHPTDALFEVQVGDGYLNLWPSTDRPGQRGTSILPNEVVHNGTTLWRARGDSSTS